MFAYCYNNPIYWVDDCGQKPVKAEDTDGDGEDDYFVYEYTRTTKFLWWTISSTKGHVHIYRNKTAEELGTMDKPDYFNSKTDVIVADWTDSQNPTMYVQQAQNVGKQNRKYIITCLQEYDSDYNTAWNRTSDSLMTEWKEHHRYAFASPRAQNIDFDNNEEGKGFFYFFWKAVNSALT